MKILAIDTSTKAGAVALVSGDELLAEESVRDSGAHAIWLMPAIDRVMKGAGVELKDIDLFALAIGPGSFTGLRIGVSTVKGLAWPLKKPVVGVSTLKALAMNFSGSNKVVCPLLDARKKEVYSALYRPPESDNVVALEALLPDSALRPEALIKEIEARLGEGDELVVAGPGLSVYGDLFKERFGEAQCATEEKWYPGAYNLALLALAGDGTEMDGEAIKPLYLRKSEAELTKPL